MKKKEAEDVQENGSKYKKALDLKKPPTVSDNRERSARTGKLTDDPRFSQAVQNYEAGLASLQAHKYDRAKALFEKVVGGPSPELGDRARVHLNTCMQLLSR